MVRIHGDGISHVVYVTSLNGSLLDLLDWSSISETWLISLLGENKIEMNPFGAVIQY